MISSFFHAFFYDPIYNALVALVAFVPGGDVGIAVILLTIIIRLILLPFSLAAARTQLAMKDLAPKLNELKDKHKNNKEKLAIETLALYREAQVNPFASILTMLVQIPVLLALGWVFFQESFTVVNTTLLYSFTPLPVITSVEFLGLIAVTGKSFVLATLAGITQYFQAHLSLSGTMNSANTPIQGDFQKMMIPMLKYVFPVLLAVISYTTSSAIALYFITMNLAGALQEVYVSRKLYVKVASK